MALATRCPSCTTVFRIGTAQAAAKGGMVRCGVCRNVFNSLDALVRVEDLEVVEEVVLQVPAPTAPVVAEPSARPVPVFETPPSNPHDEHAAAPVEPTVPMFASSPMAPWDFEDDAFTLPGQPSAMPADPVGGLPPGPAVVDEQVIIREWWMPAEEPAAGSGLGAGLDVTPVEADVLLAPSRSQRRDETRPRSSDIDGTSPVFMRPRPSEERAGRAWRWMLGLLSLVAALCLAGQLAYLWRDELAVRWPPARPWLSAACETLRCSVGYPAHPDSVTIESAAVQSVAANSNVYVMTALLRNRDSVDLRYPTLELVLTDFQDRPILRRAFRPADYLVGVAGHSPASGFPAQSELPVRITFELTDLRFAGYRLAQFYP